MSLKHVDIESALRRLAERRIEEAMREGKFDNLPGVGKPLELEPMPADENARMMWWTLRIMRNHDFIPHEVQWRKMLDGLKAQLIAATTERRVIAIVSQINEMARKINTLGTNALNTPVIGVSLQAELDRFKRAPLNA